MTPQIDHLRNMSPVLGVSMRIYGVSKEIDGRTFIFSSKPRYVTLQIHCLRKMSPVLTFQHTFMGLWGFQGDRWENIQFYSKPRHVTPQIDHLRKMSPVLRVSTHI